MEKVADAVAAMNEIIKRALPVNHLLYAADIPMAV
jgi:hypothetical protein